MTRPPPPDASRRVWVTMRAATNVTKNARAPSSLGSWPTSRTSLRYARAIPAARRIIGRPRRGSRSGRKPGAKLRARDATVRDAVLLGGRQFGHRAAVPGDHEHRVVAEPGFAARGFRDLAV